MEAVRWIAVMRETASSRTLAAAVSDEEAMGRVREGDARALALLFERYQSRLFGFLYRFVGERSAAEDLLSETMVRIYERRGTFRRGYCFAPWAYRIARNLAIQELRHQQVARRAAARLEIEARAPAGEAPESCLEKEEIRAAVAGALRALPEDQRAAAILREYEGMNYREIGEVLGCSEEAARARTYRARLALRAALAERLRD
jgi:RNA polymerase sigma-70 factor (ECF subfamily)